MINSHHLTKRKEACSNVKRQIGRIDPVERASCAEQAVIRADSSTLYLFQAIPPAGASACGFCFYITAGKCACGFLFYESN
jgi:hypothetical protein